MKPIILIIILAFASCAMPSASPEQTVEAEALGASWWDVRNEGYRYCNVLFDLCPATSTEQWWLDCLALSRQIADEAYASGCLDEAETWLRCEWRDQPWRCNGGWPWADPDACVEERGAYEVCQ